MVAAGLISYLLARSPLGVVRAHFVGAVIAALLLLAAPAWAQPTAPGAAPLDRWLGQLNRPFIIGLATWLFGRWASHRALKDSTPAPQEG